ncbi:glutamine amidotransferase [Nocardioides sp. OK12]|uniref:type 1 glutamine amidotransferase domain-containing protein n=1 Tax=Nocardioides sp. OK12 TaxID=2758661 RepID=UPI0021C378CA|nr:type 1 glutamine amidotransferase domain-containing protein [Nocardioides sp. OK12]GHJ58327.1 glutamine amidotransferase [Nocardioides sp. OK12]
MSNDLTGKRVAFIVAQSGVEQPELTQPWQAVEDAGATAVLIAPETGKVQAFESDVNEAGTFEATLALGDADPATFDAVVLPGGTTNADALRVEEDAVAFMREVIGAGKPVASICHGPWTLVETGRLEGKTLTSFPSLQTDIRNAGATWVDEESFTCEHNGWTLVTSRNPGDLDAFCEAAVAAFA